MGALLFVSFFVALGLGVVLVWREFDDVVQLDRKLALLFAFAIPVVALFAIVGGLTLGRRRGVRRLRAAAVHVPPDLGRQPVWLGL